MKSPARAVLWLLALSTFTAICSGSRRFIQAEPQTKGAFERIVPSITLTNQSMFVALAHIFESTGIVPSVERVLLADESPLNDPVFTANLPEGHVETVLDRICKLDPRYTWSRDGNVVNLFPRAVAKDGSYLFNREILTFNVENVPDAASVAIQAVRALPGPTQTLIVIGTGGLDFAEPWTASFERITIRQALNRIATHLCATCGWQVSGSRTAPTVIFYRKLKSD